MNSGWVFAGEYHSPAPLFIAVFFARDLGAWLSKETIPTFPTIESWVNKPLRVLVVEIRVFLADAAGIADAAAAGFEARRAPHVRNRRDFKLSPVLPEDALRMHHTRFIGCQLHRDIDFHKKTPPAAQVRIL